MVKLWVSRFFLVDVGVEKRLGRCIVLDLAEAEGSYGDESGVYDRNTLL